MEKTLYSRNAERQDSLNVDGEDEVVSYLQNIAEKENEFDMVDFQLDVEYDVIGEIVSADVVFDANDEMKQEAVLPTQNQFKLIKQTKEDLGEVVGVDNWVAPDPVASIEIRLPNGETVEHIFKAPVWDTNSGIFNLCEVIGFVPGSGDEIEGSKVPLKQRRGEWELVLPSRRRLENKKENTDKTSTDLEKEADKFVLKMAVSTTLVLAAFTIFTPYTQTFLLTLFINIIGFYIIMFGDKIREGIRQLIPI